MILNSVILITSVLTLVNGLDIESAKEPGCFPIPKTVQLDPVWANSLQNLYYPLMSKYDFYQIATDLLRKPSSKVSEAGVYYDSQITFDIYPNGSFVSRGYGGLSREYVSTEIRPGVSDFRPRYPTGFPEYQGTIYTTLTDNKTFIVFPFCTDEGYKSWCALSTTPTLPRATRNRIFAHLKSLGFKEVNFTEQRYNFFGGWGRRY